MGAVWSEQAKFQSWLDVEIAATEANCKLGRVPQAALDTIKAKASFEVERILEIEAEVRHDVIAFLTNVLIHVGEEGNDVVAHLGFNFEDALHLEAGLGLDGVEGLLGHAAKPAIGFGGSDFHIKPALEFRLLTPDGSHFRKGVTLDHRRVRLNNPTNLCCDVQTKKSPPGEGL